MKSILKKIVKHIWAYVFCILIAFLSWSWVFSYLTEIKAEEKVSVFIGSNGTSFTKVEQLNAGRPEYLKRVEVNVYSINSPSFDTALRVIGYRNSDIVILPEKYLSDEICREYFATISDTYKEKFENLGYYSVAGRAYAIKIHDKQTHLSAIDCIDCGEGDGEENYYLLFSNKSLHLSDLSESKNKSKADGAIRVAQALMDL